MSEPLVTIYCLAYNHEKYIRDMLDGLLMQETDFPYEIIVHDDASTDGTASIIREYEKKYPYFFKPIYQKENQYSKGIIISKEFIFPKARGKYIAHCCGDDYWTDKKKLQIQVEYMEGHPECSMCLHGYSKIEGSSKSIIKTYHCFSADTDIPADTILCWDYDHIPQASTSMYRREDARNRPDWFWMVGGIGDYPLYNYMLTIGEIHYIDRIMSVWRFHKESWSKDIIENRNKQVYHYDSLLKFLEELNLYTSYKYNESIERAKDKFYFFYHLANEEYREARKKACFNQQNIKTKVKVELGIFSPKLVRLIESLA